MSEQRKLDEVTGVAPVETDKLRSSLDETSCGDVPNDWQQVRLSAIVNDSSYGAAESAEEYNPQDPRYVRITDIDSHGRLKPDTKVSLSREKSDGYQLTEGDLLFARSGASVGKTYLYRPQDGECVYAGYLIREEIDTDVANSEFIYQYTDSPSYDRWVSRKKRTGAQPNINAQEYGNLLIPYPSLPEQRKIATVLYTVDRAIEKSKQIETQLERSKEGLIQDFLTHGTQGSETVETGTKLGNIPSHWDIVTIENILSDEEYSFTDGARYSLSSDEIQDSGDARAILLEEVKEGEFDDSDPKFATEEKYNEITHRAIYPGEVVVAKMAEPVARACIVPDTYDKYLLGCADVVRIVPNEEIEDRFLMYCMNSHKVWRQAVAHLRGTGRSRINLENISELYIPKPPLSEQGEIVSILTEIDQQIDNEQEYRNNIQRLKRGLQQDLLSGTVRTTDTNIEVPDEIAQHG